MAGTEIEELIALLARLPGLGPRSARRAMLQLMRKRENLLIPLGDALLRARDSIVNCHICGNIDTHDPCSICADSGREPGLICVVEDVGDLWALERTGAMRGRYHVLGGTLSALDGVGPDALNLGTLAMRAKVAEMREIIIATGATVEGQSTAYYIIDMLADADHVTITRLAHGVPVGGELHYLDDGTITVALSARRTF